MDTHLGLCTKCAKTQDCLETTQGSMCRPCFHKLLLSGKESIASIPDPQHKVFVLVWKLEPVEFLSVRQVIYAFEDRITAEQFLRDDLRPSSDEPLKTVQVHEIYALELIGYCMAHDGLRVISLKAKTAP